MSQQQSPAQSQANAWADECDLVLKGGITSGVVYPLAICEIAKAFRLRSIGGTSAGAIAAAAAAAAEAGRQRKGHGQLPPSYVDGFSQLEKLPDYLCETTPDKKSTRLLGFFKPAPRLRPVFNALLALLGRGSTMRRAWAVLVALVRASGLVPWLAFVVALLPIRLLPVSFVSVLPALCVIALAALIWLSIVVWRSIRLIVTEIPANNFGICSGMAEGSKKESGLALTEWLSGYLDSVSGQDLMRGETGKPLTFGDLRKVGVDLQVMTTCLTLGRPFRVPFRNDEQVKESSSFWFRREDFAALFPEYVVSWMESNQRPIGNPAVPETDPSFLRLPEPDNLPVVVAVRMSLSFPILLTAVPLYAFDNRVAKEKRRRERVWFTDGGVGSNFPIHFFDTPLPARPTFGIDLGSAENERDKGVAFPFTNNDARVSDWRRFLGTRSAQLASFLLSAVSVAKDWNHETLSRLPGFRDRIALIRLTAEQGGLNLNMSPALITELTMYGREVGKRFVRRFGWPDKWATDILTIEPEPVRLNWENHQLIRLRLLLATLSEFMSQLEAVLVKSAGTSADYKRFFNPSAGASSYRFEGLGPQPDIDGPSSQAQLARWMLEQLEQVGARLRDAAEADKELGRDTRLVKRSPRPTPELKVRPRV
jgi:predicted acylesterase/phospholipase RssA